MQRVCTQQMQQEYAALQSFSVENIGYWDWAGLQRSLKISAIGICAFQAGADAFSQAWRLLPARI